MPLSSLTFAAFDALGAGRAAYGVASSEGRFEAREGAGMSTWGDVCGMAGRLPGTVLGQAHEGSPAWYAGRHPFARLRRDEQDRDLVQVWSGDLATEQVLEARGETFPVVHTFRFRVTMWCRLDLLDRQELAELLLDSYDIRGGSRRRGAVGLSELLG